MIESLFYSTNTNISKLNLAETMLYYTIEFPKLRASVLLEPVSNIFESLLIFFGEINSVAAARTPTIFIQDS